MSSSSSSSSYTHHSPLPTTDGPYILGVDEAGRGPVLGPLVYGVAYCPLSYKEHLDSLGFADSKTLTPEVRNELIETLNSDPANLGWSVRVISPQDISSGMLRKNPVNLNQQSQQATITLIREVLDKGIQLAELYVDALGAIDKYQQYLASRFPTIPSITVATKADSKYKIVGAASIAAKVTRDRCLDDWAFEELPETETVTKPDDLDEEGESGPRYRWNTEYGSGYPSDPNTKAWLKASLEPTFGFPTIARFSWTTVKVILDKDGHAVQWFDEGQASLVSAFDSARGRDKDRSMVASDLSLKSVADL